MKRVATLQKIVHTDYQLECRHALRLANESALKYFVPFRTKSMIVTVTTLVPNHIATTVLYFRSFCFPYSIPCFFHHHSCNFPAKFCNFAIPNRSSTWIFEFQVFPLSKAFAHTYPRTRSFMEYPYSHESHEIEPTRACNLFFD